MNYSTFWFKLQEVWQEPPVLVIPLGSVGVTWMGGPIQVTPTLLNHYLSSLHPFTPLFSSLHSSTLQETISPFNHWIHLKNSFTLIFSLFNLEQQKPLNRVSRIQISFCLTTPGWVGRWKSSSTCVVGMCCIIVGNNNSWMSVSGPVVCAVWAAPIAAFLV